MKLFKSITITLISILLISISVILITMGIIPINYILIGITIGIIISIGLILLINKFNKLWIKILSIIFILIEIILIIIALYISSKTGSIIDKLTNTKYQTIGYSVLVRKTDSDNLLDYKYKEISITEDETYSKEIKKELDNKFKGSIKIDADVLSMLDNLLKDKTDIIVIRSTHLELLEEAKAAALDDAKVLFTFAIKVLSKDIKKPANIKLEPFIVLFSGIDTAGPINTVSRSDVNIIMAVNPITYEIVLVHIPRDYYVTFNGQGTKDKLTHSGIYGIDMTVKTIEDLMDIDINYYSRINFSTFTNLVDLVGDISLYNPTAFSNWGTQFDQGYITLNSAEALTYSRARKMLKGGDKDRGKNQQRVIEAIIENNSNINSINKLSDVFEIMGNSFITNLSSDDIRGLINFELNYLPKWQITSYNLNGTDLMTKGTPFYPNQKLFVLVPDTKTIDTAKNMILEVISNKE